MSTIDRDIFGSQEIAYECLADTERTQAFAEAIDGVVKSGSRVLELGTGTGILALFAARAGATRVDTYEVSKPMAAIARRNIAENDYDDKIFVHEADVTVGSINTDGAYDLLIAEMVTVGLIEEQLVPAFNNILAQGILKPDAQMVPCAQDTWCELVETDFDHFGFELKTIQIEQTWQKSKLKHIISDTMNISHVDFNDAIKNNQPIDPNVDQNLVFTAKQSGTVNAIRFTSNSILSSMVDSGWTQCMNSPAIIPIPEQTVVKGQTINLHLSYQMGGEMSSLRI